jgi:mRNA-degrading endonuclease RelE of RelBE toxin-antitoxin system
LTIYEVLLSRTALDQLRALDEDSRRRVRDSLLLLAAEPRRRHAGSDVRRLRGSGHPALYRLRVGSLRIVYAIVDRQVRVTTIRRRDKAYDFLE